jgi:hypothetical protein
MHPQFIQILRYFRMETLKEHMPGQPVGLNEVQRTAVRYENVIYTTAATKVIQPIFATFSSEHKLLVIG